MPAPLLLVASFLAAAGSVAGIWLAYSGWLQASVPMAIQAVILLMVSPALACAAFLLQKNRPELESSLRAIRLGRGHVCIVGSHVAVLGVSELWGLIETREFLPTYAALWVAMAASYLPWLRRQEKRVYDTGR
jgi:hypothetical protein